MNITAYGAIMEPIIGRISVEESIESLYDHVDSFVIVDASKYDNWNAWTKYSKVKYIKTVFPVFDNPFGTLWTLALRNVKTEYALFLDLDEIFEFPSNKNLKDILAGYNMDQYAVSFYLKHYYCSRNYTFDPKIVPTKGASVFKNPQNYVHDLIPVQSTTDGFKRWNKDINLNDGVRIINIHSGGTLEHYPPVDEKDVFIHHMSHIDYYGKIVRSFVQVPHVMTIDAPTYYPTDTRITRDVADHIYKAGEEQIEKKEVEFFQTQAVPYDYKPNELVDRYIERFNIKEFDPYEQKGYIEKYGV